MARSRPESEETLLLVYCWQGPAGPSAVAVSLNGPAKNSWPPMYKVICLTSSKARSASAELAFTAGGHPQDTGITLPSEVTVTGRRSGRRSPRAYADRKSLSLGFEENRRRPRRIRPRKLHVSDRDSAAKRRPLVPSEGSSSFLGATLAAGSCEHTLLEFFCRNRRAREVVTLLDRALSL